MDTQEQHEQHIIKSHKKQAKQAQYKVQFLRNKILSSILEADRETERLFRIDSKIFYLQTSKENDIKSRRSGKWVSKNLSAHNQRILELCKQNEALRSRIYNLKKLVEGRDFLDFINFQSDMNKGLQLRQNSSKIEKLIVSIREKLRIMKLKPHKTTKKSSKPKDPEKQRNANIQLFQLIQKLSLKSYLLFDQVRAQILIKQQYS